MVLVTPEYKGDQLAGLQKQLGIDKALVAYDPNNVKNISLQNILQCFVTPPDGSMRRVNSRGIVAAVKPQLSSGTHRVSKEGINDEKVLKLWWMLERGQKGLIPVLKKMSKSKGDQGTQAQQLLSGIQQSYDDAFASLKDATANIDIYEALEALIVANDGLDTKAAKKVLKSMAKDKALKTELKARGIWQKIQAMSASPKPKDQAAAQAGLAELAKRYPDTKYGAMAKQ